MVMSAPIAKAISSTGTTLRVRSSCAPTPSPNGVMAISAPSWNSPMPTTSIAAPTRNSATDPSSIGTIITLMASTISVMGSTAQRDSLVFSLSLGFIASSSFPPPYRAANASFCRITLFFPLSDYNLLPDRLSTPQA